MTRSRFLVVAALAVAACGSSTRTTGDPDLGAEPPDLAVPSTSDDLATSPGVDLASTIPRDLSTVTPTDLATAARDLRPAPTQDLGGTPPTTGQCYLTAQCPQGNPNAQCNADAPLGVCLCGNDTHCNAGWDDQCIAGGCIRDCSVDGDCGPSRSCSPSGRCLVKSCSTPADCSPLHTCRAGGSLCQRVQCPNGQGDCPTGTTCRTTSGGKLCVEDAYFP